MRPWQVLSAELPVLWPGLYGALRAKALPQALPPVLLLRQPGVFLKQKNQARCIKVL
jgi:hypothetical protein